MKKKKDEKVEKVELTEGDKKKIVSYMTDYDQVFDAFHEIDLTDRLEEDDDGDKEEAYYELVKEFVKDCGKKLKEAMGEIHKA